MHNETGSTGSVDAQSSKEDLSKNSHIKALTRKNAISDDRRRDVDSLGRNILVNPNHN